MDSRLISVLISDGFKVTQFSDLWSFCVTKIKCSDVAKAYTGCLGLLTAEDL
ncbi:Uncharacterized protein DAT39_006953 [Clarias magur]|uniref:Uncharacterized protein n=1 Tax=Clarias magur TaxID=1594786 RepID=A0A8J4U0J4_CLAMG|nr:Uncharacterized protein DAT39_006953 [Clarias magur]